MDMDVVFGTSSKGKQTVIYGNYFEYVKERENRCGTTSWRCQKFQSMQCKARLVISGDHVVSKTVVTCKIKHLQNICKNVLVFYFTCNQHKTCAKYLQKCFSVLFYT